MMNMTWYTPICEASICLTPWLCFCFTISLALNNNIYVELFDKDEWPATPLTYSVIVFY